MKGLTMCLAVPGKVIEIYEEDGMKMGKVDFGGTVQVACMEYVPDICIGQYTIIHAGFALSVIDEEEAQKTLDLLGELSETSQEGLNIEHQAE